MLTGAVINFFMVTITFIPDNKLAEHYLIASDMWGFNLLYTRYPSEFQHELAKAQLLNHWKKLKIRGSRWFALLPICYNGHWTLIEIEHITKTEARIRHFDSLNKNGDRIEIYKCIENWLKLINSVTKISKTSIVKLPRQAASSNDCGVYVCAFIEYASLLISWEELHTYCTPERSLQNRQAIKRRIDFFKVNDTPVHEWHNSCFKMTAVQIPKQVNSVGFWDCEGTPTYLNEPSCFYREKPSFDLSLYPNEILLNIKPYAKRQAKRF